MQDFNYLNSNAFEITVEMGCCKFPEASALPGLWEDHRPPLVAFMKRVHMGVKGTVRNADRKPVPRAEINVRALKEKVTYDSLKNLKIFICGPFQREKSLEISVWNQKFCTI